MVKFKKIKEIEINEFEPVSPDILDLYEFIGMENLLYHGNIINQIQQITKEVEILSGTVGRTFGKSQISPQLIRDFRSFNSILETTKNNIQNLMQDRPEGYINNSLEVINKIQENFQKSQKDFNQGKISFEEFTSNIQKNLLKIPEFLRNFNIAYTIGEEISQNINNIINNILQQNNTPEVLRNYFEGLSNEINRMIQTLEQTNVSAPGLINPESFTKAKNSLLYSLHQINQEITNRSFNITPEITNSLNNAFRDYVNAINPVRESLASINPEIIKVGENFINSAEKVNKFGKAFAYVGGTITSLSGALLTFVDKVNAITMQLGFGLMNLSFAAMGVVMIFSSGFQQALSKIQLQMNQLQQTIANLQLELTRFEIVYSNIMNIFQQYINPILQAADAFKQVQLSLQTVTGGANSASEVLKELYAFAINIPGTFKDLSEIVSSMLSSPVVRSQVKTTEDMKKVLKESIMLMQQMALINPNQGIQGALVALQELLGGQTRSLQLRFNLDLSQIEAAVGKSFSSVKGDAIKTIDFLKSFFGKIVPEDLLFAKTKTFSGFVEKIQDIIQATFISATDNSYNVLMSFFDRILSSADKSILAIQGRQKDLYDYLKNQGLSDQEITFEIKNLESFKNTFNLVKSEITRSTALLGESLLNAINNIGKALSSPKIAGELGVSFNVNQNIIDKISSIQDPFQKLILALSVGLNVVINIVTKFIDRLFGTAKNAEATISGIVKGFENLISIMKRLDPSIISEVITGAAKIKELGSILQVVGAKVEEISIKFGMFMAIISLISSAIMIASSLVMGLASVLMLLITIIPTVIGLITGLSVALLRSFSFITGAISLFGRGVAIVGSSIVSIGRMLFTVFANATLPGRIFMIIMAIGALISSFTQLGKVVNQIKDTISSAISGIVNILSKAFGQLIPDSVKKMFTDNKKEEEENNKNNKSQTENLQDNIKKSAGEFGQQILKVFKENEPEIKSVMDNISNQAMKFLGIEDTKNLFSGLGSSNKSLEEYKANNLKYISKIRSIEEEINSAFNQLFTARFGNLAQEYISKGDIKNVPDTIKEEFNNLLNIINILYKDLESAGKASITKLITSSSALKSILTNIKDTFLNLFRITTEAISGVKEKITEFGSEVAGKNYTVIKSIYMPEDLTSEKIEQFIEEKTKILNDAIRSMNLIVEMADNLLKEEYFKNKNINIEPAKEALNIIPEIKDKILQLLEDYKEKVKSLNELSLKEESLNIFENVLENVYGKNIPFLDLFSKSLKLDKLGLTLELVGIEKGINENIKEFTNKTKVISQLSTSITNVLNDQIKSISNNISSLYNILESGKVEVNKSLISSASVFENLKTSIISQFNKITNELKEIGSLSPTATSLPLPSPPKPINKVKDKNFKDLPPLETLLNSMPSQIKDNKSIIPTASNKVVESKIVLNTDLNPLVQTVLAQSKADAFDLMSITNKEVEVKETIKEEKEEVSKKPITIEDLIGKIPSLNKFLPDLEKIIKQENKERIIDVIDKIISNVDETFKNIPSLSKFSEVLKIQFIEEIIKPYKFLQDLDSFINKYNKDNINDVIIRVVSKQKELNTSPEMYIAEIFEKYSEIQQSEFKKATSLLESIYKALLSNNINQELATDLISKFSSIIIQNKGILEGSRITQEIEVKAMEEEFKKSAGLLGEALYKFLIEPIVEISKSFSRSFSNTLTSIILGEKPASLAYRELAQQIVKSTLEKIFNTFFEYTISSMTSLFKENFFTGFKVLKETIFGKPASEVSNKIPNLQANNIQLQIPQTSQFLNNIQMPQMQLSQLNSNTDVGNIQIPQLQVPTSNYGLEATVNKIGVSSDQVAEKIGQNIGNVAGQQMAQQLATSMNMLAGGIGGMMTGYMFFNMFGELREYYKNKGEDGKATLALIGQIVSVLFILVNLFTVLIALQTIIAMKPFAEGGIIPGRFVPISPFAEGGIIPGRFKEITAFAEGGIINKPTLGLVAEAGYSEAIIPLKRGYIPVKIQQPKSITNIFQEVKTPNIHSPSISTSYNSNKENTSNTGGITIINVADRSELATITKQENVKNSDILYNTISYESEKTREYYYFRSI